MHRQLCIGYARVPVQVRIPFMKTSGEGERGLFWFYIGTFIDFILPVARRFYSPIRVGWAHITNLDALILDEHWRNISIVEFSITVNFYP